MQAMTYPGFLAWRDTLPGSLLKMRECRVSSDEKTLTYTTRWIPLQPMGH